MTIKSDSKSIIPGDIIHDNNLLAWMKYSNSKTLALISLGIWWDFRLYRSENNYESKVNQYLGYFIDDIAEVFVDPNGHYLCHKKYTAKFWVANKYYAWRLECKSTKAMYLTVKQISILDKILKRVEERDDSQSSS